jgi:amino acid permease
MDLTTLVILCSVLIFLVLSYFCRKFMLRKSTIYFVISAIIYLLITYAFFELIRQIEIYLRDRGIYLEFGHADILLLEDLGLCLFLAFINILSVIVQRYRRRLKGLKNKK